MDIGRVLQGQTVVVTGANSGIGEGIALAMGYAGANVTVNYVTQPEKAKQVAAKNGNTAFKSGDSPMPGWLFFESFIDVVEMQATALAHGEDPA